MKKNTTDEETIAVCHPTLIPYIPWAAFSIFILLLAPFAHGVLAYQLISMSLIVLVICAVLAAFRVYGRTYYFTTERIVTRCGLLALDISEVRIEDVRGVRVKHSLLGRIFGYCSASIGTAATQGMEITIDNVRGLDRILEIVSELRES